MRPRRILVIRLGAFGDVVQSFPAFAAIRAHHPDAHVTLLTTPPYAALARAMPWFDEVWSEGRPPWHRLRAVLRLFLQLRGGRFDRVYDLQTSRRSSHYRRAVGSAAEWSGIARGASHRHGNPDRKAMLTIPRHQEQLRIAGIADFPAPDLGWLDADLAGLGLPPAFWIMVPGASARAPGKRWPAARYAGLARGLALPAVVVGGPGEAELAEAIRAVVPQAVDLTGARSPPPVLAALARRAAFAVGNDTGPMHLLAALGCPTLTLFGPHSDPQRHRPQGRCCAVLAAPDLAALEVAEVRLALADILPPAAREAAGLPASPAPAPGPPAAAPPAVPGVPPVL